MYDFIALPIAEKQLLLNEASIRHGRMSAKILEKDLWVCLILKLLFEIDEMPEYLRFKGGTSLSKSYGFIERFSEDIDLAIDMACLGIQTEDCPQFNDTRTQREKFRKKRNKLCTSIISDKILPQLKNKLSLLDLNGDWRLEISKDNTHTILFEYPYAASYSRTFGELQYGEGKYGGIDFGYIKPIIRLELGARGDHSPTILTSITPYIHDILPEIFNRSISQLISIPTLSAERTFWEKIVIINDIHHNGRPLKQNMSRHYYDLAMLIQKGVSITALENQGLRIEVIKNSLLNSTSSKDSKENTALYKLKKISNLIPLDNHISKLKKDYENMQNSGMFFNDPISFDNIIESLRGLEITLNTHLEFL